MRKSFLARSAIAEHVRGCFIQGFDDTTRNLPPVAPAIGAGSAPGLQVPGVTRPSSDFQAVRDGRRSGLLGYLVDLSTARTIAANTALALPIAGNVFHSDPLYDLTGTSQAGIARVHFQDENLNPSGTYVTVLPSAIYKVPFTQVLIENYAQAGKYLYIVYGVDIDLEPGASQQVTASIIGTVDVSDRAARALGIVASLTNGIFADGVTAAAQAFSVTGSQAAVAAQVGILQLFNPVGSGIIAYVDAGTLINTAGGAIGQCALHLYNVALATDIGTGFNLDEGSAVSKCHLRSTTNAAWLGNQLCARVIPAGLSAYTFSATVGTLSSPVRLGEGEGLNIGAPNVNQLAYADFQWREKAT